VGGFARNQQIEAIFDLIALHPHAGQLTNTHALACRRAPLSPFNLLTATDDEVAFHGVRHAARRPPFKPD
jgi:hypothetical protein